MPTVKARSSQSRPSMMGSSRAEKEPGPLRISWLWPCSAAETGWEWVWALGPEWVCAIVRHGGGSGMARGLKEAVRWNCAVGMLASPFQDYFIVWWGEWWGFSRAVVEYHI